jgi:hypothetical protein
MKPICPASLWTNTLTFLRVARLNSFISGGNMTINVNGDIGPYFQTKKNLRQGDPLSQILFNLVADMLAIIVKRAKADGQVSGEVPHLIDGGLSILQYTDDMILFMDLEKANNMKLLLLALIGSVPFLLSN